MGENEKNRDQFVRLGLCKKSDAKEIIQSLVNWLITSLMFLIKI